MCASIVGFNLLKNSNTKDVRAYIISLNTWKLELEGLESIHSKAHMPGERKQWRLKQKNQVNPLEFKSTSNVIVIIFSRSSS